MTLRLAIHYGTEKLEKACLRACTYDNNSYKTIKNILEKNLEDIAAEETPLLNYANDNRGAYLRAANEYIIKTEVYHG